MLRQLRTGKGLASSAAAAAVAAQARRDACQSLAASAVACGNLRHLSADASPSSSSSSSGGSTSSTSSISEDPRWKSPLFDALLSLAARASSSASSPPPPPTSSTSTSSSAAPPLPPPLRSVVAERHGLLDFLWDSMRTAQARMLAHFIRTNVETSFDEREFLEGAADARHAVFDALSEEGDLAPLRGAVAPGLLRALHGLKEMHAAAGLAVRMTAAEDSAAAAAAGGGGGGGGGGNDSASAPPFSTSTATTRAELGVMGLLDPPLFEAMSTAVPGFEDLPSISREIEEKMAAAAAESSSSSSSGEGSSSNSSSSSDSGIPADARTTATATANASPKSKLALSSLDVKSFTEAVQAAQSKSGVFSGRYQVLAVRFTGSVLVQTFAKKKSSAAAASAATAAAAEEEGEEEKDNASVAATSSSSSSSSKAASASSPNPTAKSTTLTLVRELLDKRPHSWRFCRGPLLEGLPVRQLGLPWMLLSIDLD